MNLVRRDVLEVINENETKFNGITMYELRMLVDDEGLKDIVDVVLMEEDYSMIKEKGYYYC